MHATDTVKVWDLFVRVFHWMLLAGFLVCYITEGKPRRLHVNTGYVVAGLILLRVVWGFVGPRYARFSDFVRGPRQVLEHLGDVVRLRSKRYLGHDPAGGAMIVALLVSLSLTVLSGMFLNGVKHNAGPFAGWTAGLVSGGVDPGAAVQSPEPQGKKSKAGRAAGAMNVKWVKETHEAIANITLTLAVIHLCGVLLVSFQTHENLVWGMISGRKKTPDSR